MRPVELPRDERPHPEHAMEWWYFVGHLTPVSDRSHPGFTIGFIVLRARVLLEGVVGIVLVVDHANGVHPMREAIQLMRRTYAPEGRTGFRFEFPGELDPARSWTIDASDDLHYGLRLHENGRYTIDLDVEPGPAHLLGDLGIVDYGQGVELAYYVRPHLPARGRLRLPGGGSPVDVDGCMWLERQWGDENVFDVEWKYLLIHVSPDEQWIFFRLRHRVGPRGERRFGCRMTAAGCEQLPEADVVVTDFGDVAGMPVGSRVRVASRDVDVIVEPLFGVDQYYRPSLSPAFFEGASEVRGRIGGREVRCWGMTEIAVPAGVR